MQCYFFTFGAGLTSSLTCITVQEPAVFSSAFVFFLFGGYTVTCLIMQTVNNRAASRTSGANVVPLEQHTSLLSVSPVSSQGVSQDFKAKSRLHHNV